MDDDIDALAVEVVVAVGAHAVLAQNADVMAGRRLGGPRIAQGAPDEVLS
ncbi:hypothetical protein [Streptomyces pseudoechinosporeus]